MALRSQIDVALLLEVLGIEATKRGNKWIASCPYPGHNDSDPSWSMIDDPGGAKHAAQHCHGCKRGGGPWELAAGRWGVDVKTAGRRLAEMGMGRRVMPKNAPRVRVQMPGGNHRVLRLPDHVEIPGPDGEWFEPALRYLAGREVPVPRWQLDRWGCGYSIRGKLPNRVVIPVYDARRRLLTYTARTILPAARPRYKQASVEDGARPRRALWGEARWEGTGIVCVAEGVFGGMALERAGAPNPTALLGSEITEEKARVLDRFDHVVIATDPDSAGRQAQEWLSVLGRRARITILDLPKAPDDIPDAPLQAVLAEKVGIRPAAPN